MKKHPFLGLQKVCQSAFDTVSRHFFDFLQNKKINIL